MRLVISDSKTGKSYQLEVEKGKEVHIVGKKIREKIDGGVFGAAGYQLELTGGSDTSGFPMRSDISGGRKIQSIISDGIGFHASDKGERRKKSLRGNTYSDAIMQVNAKVVEWGPADLATLFPKKEGEKKEVKK